MKDLNNEVQSHEESAENNEESVFDLDDEFMYSIPIESLSPTIQHLQPNFSKLSPPFSSSPPSPRLSPPERNPPMSPQQVIDHKVSTNESPVLMPESMLIDRPISFISDVSNMTLEQIFDLIDSQHQTLIKLGLAS